ncbi:MAG: nitroreductase [Gammaproteobacteria bacterium]|nr:nitroreductase [Gammaproteobacteria bacterium]NNF48836.1 nitroreductase [Woeseiaceae bacterium]MBT8093802.1 nitroreductase [Gammaproteobacteria bacterium]MBT8105886.1 nitroreductase [Gammaproteobacteria bacterium]NNK25900.1 nitroreductase [Woeseiaceae bacterium]
MKKEPSYETAELREFARVLRGRRTVDQYLQTKVPDELVREAIEVATWAPNHYVSEPWRFILPGSETVERIIALNAEMVAASKTPDHGEHKRRVWQEKPGWLVVTCRRSDDALREREDYAACCAAIQNLTLYLWKAGVGSKWTTGAVTRDPRFFDIIGSDADAEFVVGMLWYGYPKVTPTQSRRPLDEVVTKLP